MCARTALEVAFNRPIRFAHASTAHCWFRLDPRPRHPTGRGHRAAAIAGGELREYPIDHVDVYSGPALKQALAISSIFWVATGAHRVPLGRETTTDWSHR